MTVAFDAATPSGAGGGSTFTTTSPHTYLHTPVGDPSSVLVAVISADPADPVNGAVMYGTVAMTRVPTNGFAADILGEAGSVVMYELGSSIPTGPQTVSISHTGSAAVKLPVCITLTAAADTEIGASGKLEGDQADPQIALDTGATESFRVAVLFSGVQIAGSLTAVTDVSAVGSSPRVDFGEEFGLVGYQTSAASAGSMTIGWTAVSDDVAMIAVAIQEVAGGTLFTISPSGSITRQAVHRASNY